MHWVSTRYALHFRSVTATLGYGHVFKQRYFAKGVEDALGLLTVLGYIERNASEAHLVTRAEDWPWCSLSDRPNPRLGLGSYESLSLPTNWREMVNSSWPQFLVLLLHHDLERRRAKWSAVASRPVDPISPGKESGIPTSQNPPT
jgi:hypothetical protein